MTRFVNLSWALTQTPPGTVRDLVGYLFIIYYFCKSIYKFVILYIDKSSQ